MIVNVTYDLKRPGQNYADLIKELKNLGDWWHALQSTWLLDTAFTPPQVWDRISKYVDQNDSVLVIEMRKGTSIGAQGWLPQDAWGWIQARL